MAALAGEARSGATLAILRKRSAVGQLLAVVTVAMPDRARVYVDIEYLVEHLDGSDDDRIVRRAKSVAHELEEPAVDDIPS